MKPITYLLSISFLFFQLTIFGQDNQAPKTCVDCHAKLLAKKKIHGPAANACDKCHKPNDKVHPLEDVEGFSLVAKVPELCYGCHEMKKTAEHLHPPFGDGNCLDCHEVHSSNEDFLISIKAPGLCFSCHSDLQDTIKKSALVHGAVTEKKSCLNCHSPHLSSEKKILLSEEQGLCLSCHNKIITVGTRTIPDMKQLIEKSKYVHGAIENNGCAVCHNPHFSENAFLLKNTFPVGNYAKGKKESYALCFTCHEKEMIEEPVTTEATGFRNGNKNLHYLHVMAEKGRSCSNCHSLHASNNLYLIADKSRFGSWDMPINYTRMEKGGSCAPGCHTKKTYQR